MRLLLFLSFYTTFLSAQLPYDDVNQYPVRKETGIQIGNVANYCGFDYTLKINLYKPMGDNNLNRPVIICIPGGGPWAYADENDPAMDEVARNFASRGYVAVVSNYRKGLHLYPFPSGSPMATSIITLTVLCDWSFYGGMYPADHNEVQRGVFRCSQDIKSVVKFMKGNHEADSSCVKQVFLLGHSAGAMIALEAALLDLPAEKPTACYALTDANNPDWKDNLFQLCGPENKEDSAYIKQNPGQNHESPSCYQRPDLGSIEGSLFSANGYDASVLGVASWAGNLIYQDSALLSGSQQTAIYMYHQTNDSLAPFGVQKPFLLFNYLLSPFVSTNWPVVAGAGWLDQKLNNLNWAAGHRLWAYTNPVPQPYLFGAENHGFQPSLTAVIDSTARFFAEKIQSSPPCLTNATAEVADPAVSIFPNPTNGLLHISWQNAFSGQVEIFNAVGESFLTQTFNGQHISLDLSSLGASNGLYFVKAITLNQSFCAKVIYNGR